jgi:dolichol-phosphate mannosyltransferase
MRHALEQSPDLVCQMDADGSHDVDDLPRLVAAARDCDLVIGSRYVAGGALVNWPWHRLALSRTANAYLRTMMRMGVHDCTAGMRCWKPATLTRLSIDTLSSAGYAFQVETLYRTLALGCRVREVPITFTERQRGSSKMDAGVMFEALTLPWRLRKRPMRRPEEYPRDRERRLKSVETVAYKGPDRRSKPEKTTRTQPSRNFGSPA